LPSIKESVKLILDPHPDPDQHQTLITCRGSPLPMPTMFGQHPLTRASVVPAHRQNDRRNKYITPPVLVEEKDIR